MIYKHEIKPFNEFWLGCDTETLYSILISINERYNVLTYCNDYRYDLLIAYTPTRQSFNEIRLNQEVFALREKIINQVHRYRFPDMVEGLEILKKHIKEGYLLLVSIDLFYWVELNMCYQTHHADHYALIHGYDDERNTFYAMDTDNEKYREFEIKYEHLLKAMSAAELTYNAVVLKINPSNDMELLYTLKELRKNAKKIIKSIYPLRRYKFWLYKEHDYKNGFYRDMTVMFLMQINCRMKANRLLFEYMQKFNNDSELDEIYETAYSIEKGWVKVRETVSKLYFKNNPVGLMLDVNKNIQILMNQEMQMWKRFIKLSKFLSLPEKIL